MAVVSRLTRLTTATAAGSLATTALMLMLWLLQGEEDHHYSMVSSSLVGVPSEAMLGMDSEEW